MVGGKDGLIIVVVTISSENGQIVSGPDIISRGFVYVRENEELMEEARRICDETLMRCEEKGVSDWNTMKSQVRESLGNYIYETTKRRPIILPIFLEV